jgi:DNA repair protein RecN (Recombination protein N)
MLRRLKVENYALIDRLELELDDRLNIITGETGAGKSILLGALGLLLGNKNDNATLKDDKRNCLIEGVFDLGTRDLQAFFDRNDLDYSRETTLTRQITPAGKSRSFINDTPVPLALLRELGSQLIDIHSQHQNLILGSEAFRTQAVDTVAENHDLRMQYTTLYERLCHLRRELARLREEAEAGRKDEEWLRYQVEELAAAHLKEGEQTELEQELEVLSNADRISETLTALRNALDDEQIGVLVQLKASETACRHLEAGYPFAAEAAGRLRSVLEELKDLGASAAAQSERLDADPERLQKIGDRLNTIYSLCQKHRAADLGELLAKQTDYEARLQAITHGDEAIAAVATELTATEEKAEELARNIHATREKAAPTFNDAIQTTLARLGMPEARFVVQLTPAPALTPTGDDEIDFLFTANGNFAPQKVERIASGGEISRVMLALKALLAHRMELPTIIFDEIDTGVSGRIADAMGEIIADLSQTMQVVDITHLPQVASKGDTHFVVYKDAEGSHIRRLDPEERITEIAKCYRAAKSRKPHSHKPVSYWTNNRYVGTRSFSRIERSDRRYSRSVNTFTKLIALSRKRVRTLPTCRAGQWISRRNLQCRHFAIGNPSVTGCHILYGNSRSAKSAANLSIRHRQTKIYRHTPFFYASVKSFSQRVRLMNRRVVKTDRICKKRN